LSEAAEAEAEAGEAEARRGEIGGIGCCVASIFPRYEYEHD
jgi:hypothetical protein